MRKGSEQIFSQLSDLEKKQLYTIANKLAYYYQSPFITGDDLIHELYLSIREKRRNIGENQDPMNFMVNSLRSIASNINNRKQNMSKIHVDIDECDRNQKRDIELRKIEIEIAFKEIISNFPEKYHKIVECIFTNKTFNTKDISDHTGENPRKVRKIKREIIKHFYEVDTLANESKVSF